MDATGPVEFSSSWSTILKTNSTWGTSSVAIQELRALLTVDGSFMFDTCEVAIGWPGACFTNPPYRNDDPVPEILLFLSAMDSNTRNSGWFNGSGIYLADKEATGSITLLAYCSEVHQRDLGKFRIRSSAWIGCYNFTHWSTLRSWCLLWEKKLKKTCPWTRSYKLNWGTKFSLMDDNMGISGEITAIGWNWTLVRQRESQW